MEGPALGKHVATLPQEVEILQLVPVEVSCRHNVLLQILVEFHRYSNLPDMLISSVRTTTTLLPVRMSLATMEASRPSM